MISCENLNASMIGDEPIIQIRKPQYDLLFKKATLYLNN